ncbi:metallophosphoesterase family protein [Rhodocaloribacter sp.]
MKIAVLSDVHDHLGNLRAALGALGGVGHLIYCGDLCSPFVMKRLADDFPGEIHVVFGNNDADTFRITSIARGYGARVRLHGEFADVTLGGRRIAVQHFDAVARPLAASGWFDVVCFGHNHVAEVSRTTAGGRDVLLLNPGTLMGVRFEGGEPVPVDATFAVYDTDTGAVARFAVRGQGGEAAPAVRAVVSLGRV